MFEYNRQRNIDLPQLASPLESIATTMPRSWEHFLKVGGERVDSYTELGSFC